MPKRKTKQLCYMALLAAMYVPLSLYLSIQAGNVRLTFGSLPVVVCALLWGPLDAAIVAAAGELIKQLLTYGITYTTVLYLIPPALRGIIIGAAVVFGKRQGWRLEERRWISYAVSIVAAIATTTGNTHVNWLDSVLLGYYTPALIFGDALIRFAVGMLTAVIVISVAIPLVKVLRKRKIVDAD